VQPLIARLLDTGSDMTLRNHLSLGIITAHRQALRFGVLMGYNSVRTENRCGAHTNIRRETLRRYCIGIVANVGGSNMSGVMDFAQYSQVYDSALSMRDIYAASVSPAHTFIEQAERQSREIERATFGTLRVDSAVASLGDYLRDEQSRSQIQSACQIGTEAAARLSIAETVGAAWDASNLHNYVEAVRAACAARQERRRQRAKARALIVDAFGAAVVAEQQRQINAMIRDAVGDNLTPNQVRKVLYRR
jgi:hypothetical protein